MLFLFLFLFLGLLNQLDTWAIKWTLNVSYYKYANLANYSITLNFGVLPLVQIDHVTW